MVYHFLHFVCSETESGSVSKSLGQICNSCWMSAYITCSIGCALFCSKRLCNYADNDMRGPIKVSKRGVHLNAAAPQSAPEESSERAGGADSIMELSHYETISSTSLTLGIKSPQPLSPYINL